MDFKIKIKCHKCMCKFELRPESINCTKIICPNCTSEVKPEYSAHILNGIRELSLVPESYSDDDELIYPQTGFLLKYNTIHRYKDLKNREHHLMLLK